MFTEQVNVYWIVKSIEMFIAMFIGVNVKHTRQYFSGAEGRCEFKNKESMLNNKINV